MSSITIIGTGNAAWHLCNEFSKQENEILVVGRNLNALQRFATSFGVDTQTIGQNIQDEANFYILALHDDVISLVSKQLPESVSGMVLHTSGTANLDVLNRFENYGVFYPLQSMKMNEALNFSKVPILIEANSDKNFKILLTLAKSISNEVDEMKSLQRQKLHVAAVFANNFSNHMVSIAREICEQENVSFSYLLPLIKETFNKAQIQDSRTVQTGPAMRDDESTINKHLASLENHSDRKLLYELITKSIQKMHID